MSERLPVPGDDFGAWGDILNGFLRVSHNEDGTETLPGGSYLIASFNDILAATSGAVESYHFTAQASAGSDIEVDGMDDTLVNILTTGWYQFAFGYQIFPDSGNLVSVFAQASLSSVPLVPAALSGSFTSFTNLISYPALPLSAGDTIQVLVSGTTDAGTWSNFAFSANQGGSFQIVRLS